MAVTRSPRFRLHRWDSGADPFNRAQNDTDNLQVETLGAVFRQGPSADIGDPTAAAYARSFYFDTTVSVLYFSDGTNWVSLNDAGETGDIQPLTIGGSSSAGSVSAPASGIKTVEFALANHVHGLPAPSTPSDTGTTNLAGSALTPARSDHVHAIGSNSINSSGNFAAGVVDTAALGSSAVTTAKIADSNVTTAKVADSAITTAKVNDGAITGPKLAASVAGSGLVRNVSTSVLDVNVDGSTITIASDTLGIPTAGVGATQLASSAVTTAKIADSAITTAKVADASVTGAKLASAVAGSGLTQNVSGNLDVNADGTTISITTDALGVVAGGIGTTQLANSAVTTAKINDGAITGAKIASATITADKFATGAISGGALDDGAVITQKLADSAVTAAKIASNAVTTVKINDAAVTPAKLASSTAGSGLTQNVTTKALDLVADGTTVAVTAGSLSIVTGGVGATQLANNAVTAAKIATSALSGTGAITGGAGTSLAVAVDNTGIEINTNALRLKDSGVTSAKIASGAVGATALASNAVTTVKITDAAVTGVKLAAAVAGVGLTQNVSGNLDVSTSSTIAANASNQLAIVDSSVGTTQLTDSGVTTAKINNGAVTAAKLATDSVGASQIAAAVAGAGLSKNGTTGVLDVNVGGPISISSDAITIAAEAITSTYIGPGAVTSTGLASEAVGTAKVADGAITGPKIASSVAGTGLSRNVSTGVLSVAVDGSTISTSGGSLIVASGGIGTTQLANSAVIGSKSGAGVYRNATNADTGGSIRYSTSAPSGTAANGDIWLRYS
jgi:hypothetical protein